MHIISYSKMQWIKWNKERYGSNDAAAEDSLIWHAVAMKENDQPTLVTFTYVYVQCTVHAY